jgi:hypothetical protein
VGGCKGRSAPPEGGAEIDHRPGRPQSGQPGLTRGLATAQAQMMNVKLCREVYALTFEAGPKKNYWTNVEEPATYRFNNAPGATLSRSTAGRDRARFSKPPRSWDLKNRSWSCPRVLQVYKSTRMCRTTDAPVLQARGGRLRGGQDHSTGSRENGRHEEAQKGHG